MRGALFPNDGPKVGGRRHQRDDDTGRQPGAVGAVDELCGDAGPLGGTKHAGSPAECPTASSNRSKSYSPVLGDQ